MKELLKIVLRRLIKSTAEANLWYNKLEEPTKFIVAVIYGYLPFMFFVGLGFYIVGILWVAIFVIALRAWWLYGNLRSYLHTGIEVE